MAILFQPRSEHVLLSFCTVCVKQTLLVLLLRIIVIVKRGHKLLVVASRRCGDHHSILQGSAEEVIYRHMIGSF